MLCIQLFLPILLIKGKKLKSNSQLKSKIPVGILGATGSVGQKFIELLTEHPWFEIAALAASDRSAGKTYRDAAHWFMTKPLPDNVAKMIVKNCEPNLPCRIVFSGLDASVAGEIETDFAKAGYIVISNSRNHRYDPDVPILVPEVNSDHLAIIATQKYGRGAIITNPNCAATGLVVALKPLLDQFGLSAVNVVTMQAISGAGYPGVASLDIVDNVIPFISGEEAKLEREPQKILGKYLDGHIEPAQFIISAACNRVAVVDGHTECISVKLERKPIAEEIIAAWREFQGEPQRLKLPSAPEKPLHYFEENNYPQPKLHRHLGNGMTVSLGRLRECPILDYKFVMLSHNTIRGAAGGAILNAELFIAKGGLEKLR
ncbi:MAG: aspartate-semialdehyde dehydrogenase [Candidatus Marinimicrobia bacterium]|nr:aspartate-semialdehyde dehydrogenase [Candidatus Neomarinimicrobiota bacterium]